MYIYFFCKESEIFLMNKCVLISFLHLTHCLKNASKYNKFPN